MIIEEQDKCSKTVILIASFAGDSHLRTKHKRIKHELFGTIIGKILQV